MAKTKTTKRKPKLATPIDSLGRVRQRTQSHQHAKLNQWKPVDMEQAIKQVKDQQKTNYQGERLSLHAISEMYGVPRETLHKQAIGQVEGSVHCSGGDRWPKILSQGELGRGPSLGSSSICIRICKGKSENY